MTDKPMLKLGRPISKLCKVLYKHTRQLEAGNSGISGRQTSGPRGDQIENQQD